MRSNRVLRRHASQCHAGLIATTRASTLPTSTGPFRQRALSAQRHAPRRRRLALHCIAVALAELTTVRTARGQLGIESLFKDVNDVSFFFSCWSARSAIMTAGNCPSGRHGFGVEVTYDLGRLPFQKSAQVKRVDTTWTGGTASCETPIDASGKSGGPCRYEATYVLKQTTTPPVRYIGVEFGFGYSQFSGFRSAVPGLEINGSVREFPSAAIYGSLNVGDAGPILSNLSPYIGLRSGLVQLVNASLYDRYSADTLTSYSGAGTTFQAGVAGGIAYSVGGRVNVYYEGQYNYRRFPSVQWAASGSPRVRTVFPRDLSFSGPSHSVGVQFRIRNPAP